jgi:hypothetical protein
VYSKSLGNIVGIAIAYGPDDQSVEVKGTVGSRSLTSPYRPDQLWGSPNLLSNGYWGSFPGGKPAVALRWPLTSDYYRGQENVHLYIHSPIRLHDVVLNYLSTGTI